MKIAIVSTGYFWFPCESGFGRLFDLSNAFIDAGFEVDTYVPDFQHHSKSPRDKNLILSKGYRQNIIFAGAPAYSKNISFARIKSNKVLKNNIKTLLTERIKTYDAVFVSVPPNDIAAMVVKLCNQYNIPCLADVEDLWPEAMRMVLKNDGLRNFLLSGFLRDAEAVYSGCDGVIGTSEDYTQRAFKNHNRSIPNKTVYVGVDIEGFDSGVKDHTEEIEKSSGQFWVTYAGSISKSYDIVTLVEAAKLLIEKGYEDIRIHILGTGSNYESLKTYAGENGIDNVTFHGFVAYPKMAAFLSVSDVLVNSFVKGAVQSIVNKVGDYLAAGKPMINTLENPVFCSLVEREGFGVNVCPEDAVALCETILTLYNDKVGVEEMGKRARSLCEREFDRKLANQNVIEMINAIIKEHGK